MPGPFPAPPTLKGKALGTRLWPFTIHVTSGLKALKSLIQPCTATHLELILSTSSGWSEHRPHSFTSNDGSISIYLFFLQEQLQEHIFSIYGHPSKQTKLLPNHMRVVSVWGETGVLIIMDGGANKKKIYGRCVLLPHVLLFLYL